MKELNFSNIEINNFSSGNLLSYEGPFDINLNVNGTDVVTITNLTATDFTGFISLNIFVFQEKN